MYSSFSQMKSYCTFSIPLNPIKKTTRGPPSINFLVFSRSSFLTNFFSLFILFSLFSLCSLHFRLKHDLRSLCSLRFLLKQETGWASVSVGNAGVVVEFFLFFYFLFSAVYITQLGVEFFFLFSQQPPPETTSREPRRGKFFFFFSFHHHHHQQRATASHLFRRDQRLFSQIWTHRGQPPPRRDPRRGSLLRSVQTEASHHHAAKHEPPCRADPNGLEVVEPSDLHGGFWLLRFGGFWLLRFGGFGC